MNKKTSTSKESVMEKYRTATAVNGARLVSLTREELTAIIPHNQNREINIDHVGRLKKEIKSALGLVAPVIVNVKTLHIIDGMHRVTAFCELVDEELLPKNSKLNIYFISELSKDELAAIVTTNTNTRTWTLSDYVDSYAKASPSNSFKDLQEFCKEHQICYGKTGKYSYTHALQLLGYGHTASIRKGTFTVSGDELKVASDIHGEIVKISEALRLPTRGHFYIGLIKAWRDYRNDYSFDVWMNCFSRNWRRYRQYEHATTNHWNMIFAQAESDIRKGNLSYVRNKKKETKEASE